MATVLAPEVLVDCACRPALARPVLCEEIRANCNVTACVRCGEISATVAIVDEPYPHDTHHVGNDVYALTGAARVWLAKFPRCTKRSGRGRGRIFLAADVRAPTEVILRELEEIAHEQQRHLDFVSRLRAAGVPDSAAPVLPHWLSDFRGLPGAIALTPDAPLKTIAGHMATFGDSGLVAADVFERRATYQTELATLLNDADRDMQLAAHEFIRDRRLLNAELIKIFERQLRGPEPPVGLGVLLSTFYTLGSLAKPLVPALRDAAELTRYARDRLQILRIAELVDA